MRRDRPLEGRDPKAGPTEKSAFYHIIQLVWLWSGATMAAGTSSHAHAAAAGSAPHTHSCRGAIHTSVNDHDYFKKAYTTLTRTQRTFILSIEDVIIISSFYVT